MKQMIKCTFINMKHWGSFYFLPSIELFINFSMPTFIFMWMVFRFDIAIYKKLPDWFMNNIWNIMNFDFLDNNNKQIEEP